MQKARHVKGVALIELVKLLKQVAKRPGAAALPPKAQALLAGRVLISDWYALENFHELLRLADRLVLKSDEARTIEMGAAGGAAMRSQLKAYAIPGDTQSSVLAMRHAWRAHYDFGVIGVETPSARSVLFRLSDYPDIPKIHGLMTAGWALSAARSAGSTNASLEFHERPWQGAPELVYTVRF
jgi:hypothetical protein